MDKRAGNLMGEYKAKAKEMDRSIVRVDTGEIWPVLRNLAEYRELKGPDRGGRRAGR